MNAVRACLCAAAIVFAAAPSGAQPPASPVHLLDVPYVPQSEALCGGAAAAMVMRFWGARDVYAETFSGLVDPKAGGIHGEDLARALRERGWQALTFAADLALVRSHTDKGQPVIALVEDRPGRFHYVVIVAVGGREVIVHDPARAPFRVLDAAAFTRAWERSGSWSLLALPPSSFAKEHETPHEVAVPAEGPCGGMVDEGVRLAQAGQADEARRVLELASEICPADAAPWRERAGLHAISGEWRQAAADARQALRRDRHDGHAARILATAQFLDGHTAAALDAWNLDGEPTIDLINIQGLGRTRYEVVRHALGLEPRALLTAAALERAARQASEVPSVLVSRVSYRPDENGRAQIDAVIVERSLVPSGIAEFGGIGLRAVTDRELSASLASPSGGGELWNASWRWWRNRPRTALSFGVPATGALRGVWRIDTFDEKQTYLSVTGSTVERRRGATLQLSSWATGRWRWSVGAGVDRWSGRGTSASIDTTSEYRALADRLAMTGRFSAFQGAVDTWAAGIEGEWRTRTRHERSVLLVRTGLGASGTHAPLALWPGASSGQGRDVLLRAHPLLQDGIIARGVFGRRLVHAGVEWRRWLRPLRRTFRVAPAVFADAASAFRSRDPFETRAQLDAGFGVRLGIPGGGVLRIDLARGLRGGRTVLSMGWTR